MKKSETRADDKWQPAGENLEAPICLTPEELETVAAGLSSGGGSSGATTGFAPRIKLS